MPRIDMDKIENIILNTPGIDQAEKEFYTGILKARKENILDYSANQLSREKGAITLTKGVFDKSIRDGLIESNPCLKIDLPLYKRRCKQAIIKIPQEGL